MEGRADGASGPSVCYSAVSSTRQRAPRNSLNDDSDGVFYKSSWAGMGEEAVETRSAHVFWRVFRLALLAGLLVCWFAILVACIVILAQGESVHREGCPHHEARPWFDTAVGYQIFPASFQDSDGDGVGDLKGIVSRLEYLEYLGVDSVWLGPVFESSHLDLWTDVTDLIAVDGVYGTMDDFDGLLAALHAKDMKLVLEFIPSHTSDHHPWFQASRQSTNNEYSEYYIWVDGVNGRPPEHTTENVIDDLSWEYDSIRRQWYLYSLIKERPFLNYRNPEVNRDIKEKTNKTLDVIAEWRQLLDDYTQYNGTRDNPRVLVVDTDGDLFLATLVYSNKSLGTRLADFPFNFVFLDMAAPLNGNVLRTAIETWVTSGPIGGSRQWAIGTTGVSRVASRCGERFSRALMFMMLLLPGTPLVYYGDEIGMKDGRNITGSGATATDTLSPMQWSSDIHAGFTDATSVPWLPVGANASIMNVELQRNDNHSIVSFIKQTIRFRKTNSNLFGIDSFRLQTTYNEILAFTMEASGRNGQAGFAVFGAINVARYGVVENYENRNERIPSMGVVVVSTDPSRIEESINFSKFPLGSGEAILVRYTPLPKPDGFSESV